MKFHPAAFLVTAFITSTLLVSGSGTAVADQQELGSRLKNCKAITSLISRAECYDEVVRDFDLENMNRVDSSGQGGKWKVTNEKSPVSDNINYYATLASDDYLRIDSKKFARPEIVLRCTDKALSGYVVWDQNLGSQDVVVNLRIDQEKTLAETWSLSADRTATFIGNAETFSKIITGKKKIILSVWQKNREPLSATFDLQGTGVALSPLLKACAVQ